MITAGVIRNGANYLSHHLKKNDYWAEGEKEVNGEWIGEAAKALGLSGAVTEEAFDALRRNRHPTTGKNLTSIDGNRKVAFVDIQLSAPKDVSVLAMVGGDERVRVAFVESVKVTLVEMERFAAVRERRGNANLSEQYRLTGNFAGGLFIHDASRDLDPQLHAHAVLANLTWDPSRNAWFAIQPAEMLRASGYLRQVLYRELATRLRGLGYDPYEMSSTGFSVRGIEHLRERYSKRTRHVQSLAEAFLAEKGRKPTKKEVEIMVRESREDKLTEATTKEVRQRQRAELSEAEAGDLQQLVTTAVSKRPVEQRSKGEATEVLAAAMRHVYERRSVVRESEVLHAALELHPDFYRWIELRGALASHPDTIRKEGEVTLRPIRREEQETVVRVQDGRDKRLRIGNPPDLSDELTPGQRVAAEALLRSRDFLSVLIGDAGTGKTTVLKAIERAHVQAGGQAFITLAPTTRARDALVDSGFPEADTVQRFLVSAAVQAQAAGRLVLVDEAGLLSTQQLDQLTKIAAEAGARVLLVGDTKQHYSVQRGDALRNVIKHSGTPVAHLTEVLRQRSEADRQFSRLIAAGEIGEAFGLADRRGMIKESADDATLFTKAANHYADNRSQGVETLVVIPFWDEIERFNKEARPALRRHGLLGEAEVLRESVRPLTWTNEQKVHWSQYKVGDRIQFVRDTQFFKRGVSAEVVQVLPDGIKVRGPKKREAKLTRRQTTAFDVGRLQVLGVSAGDRILIRGRNDDAGFDNGDLREVEQIDATQNKILLKGGGELPADFSAWTYGHAMTAYRSQGSTAEESILVLGEMAAHSLAHRQFYVGNTRYRGSHAIYVSNKEELLQRLYRGKDDRELATEFMQRQGIAENENLVPRPLRGLKAHLRMAWLGFVEKLRMNRTQGETLRQ